MPRGEAGLPLRMFIESGATRGKQQSTLKFYSTAVTGGESEWSSPHLPDICFKCYFDAEGADAIQCECEDAIVCPCCEDAQEWERLKQRDSDFHCPVCQAGGWEQAFAAGLDCLLVKPAYIRCYAAAAAKALGRFDQLAAAGSELAESIEDDRDAHREGLVAAAAKWERRLQLLEQREQAQQAHQQAHQQAQPQEAQQLTLPEQQRQQPGLERQRQPFLSGKRGSGDVISTPKDAAPASKRHAPAPISWLRTAAAAGSAAAAAAAAGGEAADTIPPTEAAAAASLLLASPAQVAAVAPLDLQRAQQAQRVQGACQQAQQAQQAQQEAPEARQHVLPVRQPTVLAELGADGGASQQEEEEHEGQQHVGEATLPASPSGGGAAPQQRQQGQQQAQHIQQQAQVFPLQAAAQQPQQLRQQVQQQLATYQGQQQAQQQAQQAQQEHHQLVAASQAQQQAQQASARLVCGADGTYRVLAPPTLYDVLDGCGRSLSLLGWQAQLACCDEDDELFELTAAPPPALAAAGTAGEQLLSQFHKLLQEALAGPVAELAAPAAALAAGTAAAFGAPPRRATIDYLGSGQKVLTIPAAPLLDAERGQQRYAAVAAALAAPLGGASGWELYAEASRGRLVLLRGPQRELTQLLQPVSQALR
ncbi:hypothetical protein ABPG75_010569 [Micractinium tetrahymenae]